MNKIEITNYSCYGNYTIKGNGTNCSTIVTKMIHLAGNICGHYASDIVYDANAYMDAIDNNKDFDRYLFFGEMGVTTLSPTFIRCIRGTKFVQAWHLTYNAETQEQEFTRVRIKFVRRW